MRTQSNCLFMRSASKLVFSSYFAKQAAQEHKLVLVDEKVFGSMCLLGFDLVVIF